jgi:murein DD-endopeptidase MepM/ murein hydrolase activator NlpD
MRNQADWLAAGIVSAVLVAALAPAGGTSFQFSSGAAPAFSESLLLTVAPVPREPAPETFRALGGLGRVVIGQYDVRSRDTLAGIAKNYGSSADFLRSTNRLESTTLPPGKTILVHNGQGMLHQVRGKGGAAETLQEVSRRYNRAAVQVARANRLPGVSLLSPGWVSEGSVLFIPGARLRFTDYMFPVSWSRGMRQISSGFGMRRHPVLKTRRFHTGIDIPRPYGFHVRAAREGRVVFAGWRGAYGRLVIIKHAGGVATWYGHLSSIDVAPGARVPKGKVVGRVGSSGMATGPHLHFEVRDRYGNSLNPRKFL